MKKHLYKLIYIFSFIFICAIIPGPTAIMGSESPKAPLILFCGQSAQSPLSQQGKLASSDPKVAFISSSGMITANEPGASAVYTEKRGEIQDSILVIVIKAALPETIQSADEELRLEKGAKKAIVASALPTGSIPVKLTYTSGMPEIASVDNKGVVTGISAGEAWIFIDCEAPGMPIKGKSLKVIVTDAQAQNLPSEAAEIIKESVDITIGACHELEYAIYPEGSSGVVWRSSDESVARVSESGSVLAIKEGRAVVTARAMSGNEDSVEINAVRPALGSISFPDEEILLIVGEYKALKLNISPEGAKPDGFIWGSSNPSVIAVDSNGMVKALASGGSWVSARLSDGSIEASAYVKAEKIAVGAISVPFDSLELEKGQSADLPWEVSPWNATDQNVAWSSSDESVIKVDNGRAYAAGYGEARLKASLDGASSTVKAVVPAKVQSIAANPESAVIYIGEGAKIDFAITPYDLRNQRLSITSSDPQVAEVSQSGSVKGLKEGQAVITAVSPDGPSASCRIAVISRLVEYIEPSEGRISIFTGKTAQIKWSVSPSNAHEKGVSIISSDPSSIQVDKDGKITALKKGKATITITALDRGRKTAKVEVEAKDIMVETVSGLLGSFSFYEGDEKKLSLEARPRDATNPAISVKSSDPKVASYNNGVVKAIKPGSCQITVTALDSGKVLAEIPVKVIYVDVDSVSFGQNALTMETGKKLKMQASVKPQNASNPLLAYQSSDVSVASVSPSGEIYAAKAGTATITARSLDNPRKTSELVITCVQKAQKIEAKISTSVLFPKGEAAITYKVLPDDTTDPSVIISSSDKNKAYCDQDNIVHAVSSGLCYISIKALDGSGAEARVQVSVHNKDVLSVHLEPRAITLFKGEESALSTSVTPKDASEAGVSYSSSDTSVAKVTEDGVITAVASGKAKVMAVAKDGSGSSDEVTVSVLEAVEKVEAPEAINLFVGGNALIGAKVVPETAFDRALGYYSSDPSVASVDSGGSVRALSPGKCRITISVRGNSGATATVAIDVKRPVSEISISQRAIELYTGDTKGLGAAALPEDATDKSIKYSSSDASIAQVSESGLVKGIKAGSATIYAKASDGSGAVAQAGVTVKQKVEKISLGPSPVTAFAGGTAKLVATASPLDANDKSVRWASSNLSVATVDASGNVTALKAGRAVISAVAKDFGEVSAECEVIVLQKVEALMASKRESKLKTGESEKIRLNYSPQDASDKQASFESSDPVVASVSADGTITAKKSGSCVITATAKDGGGATCKVSVIVTQLVESITVPKDAFVIYTGEVKPSGAKAMPEDAEAKGLVFATADKAIATVDLEGNIKGVRAGKTEISVYSSDGGNVKALFNVEVRQSVTRIKIERGSIYLNTGEVDRITAIVEPYDATANGVKWSSSDPSVASVDSSGNIRARKAGQAVIKATAQENNDIFAQASVTVRQKTTSITFSKSEVSIFTGESYGQKAQIHPTNVTNAVVSYKSSNPLVAPVDSEGQIKGLKPGTAVITAYSDDGSGAQGSYKATVIQKSASLTLEDGKSPITINSGYSYTIKYKILPEDSSEKELSFSSDSTRVAEVDQNGTVKGIKAGKATITARTKDASKLESKIEFIINQLVTSYEAPKTLIANVGEPLQIAFEPLPKDSTDKTAIFESSDPSVLEVDSKGIITAKRPGKAIVTLKASDKGGAEAKIEVEAIIKLVSIAAAKPALELLESEKANMNVSTKPIGALIGEISYQSDNPTVASVSKDGVITAEKSGKAVITATVSDNKGISCKVEVTVKGYNSRVQLDKREGELYVGALEQLTATSKGKNGEPGLMPIIWSSSNNKVATVANGLVKAVSAGSAIITATSGEPNSVSGTYSLKVLEKISSITLDRSAFNLFVGGEAKLKAQVFPIAATGEKLAWESSDPSVARVDNGLIKGLKVGEAKITVKSEKWPEINKSANVLVTQPVKSISFPEKTIKINIGEQKKINAALEPPAATETSLSWSSSNSEIASISSDGTLKALKNGMTTITAKSVDSNGATASIKVTVETKAEGFSVAPKTVSMAAGQNRQLIAAFYPEGATVPQVLWESSDESVAIVTSAGFLRAIGPGKASISAKADGWKASCEVSVTQLATGIQPESTYMPINIGDKETIHYKMVPENTTSQSLSFTSTDEKIAKVSPEGVVSALAIGNCEIILKTTDGTSKEGRVTVLVKEPITKLSLGIDKITLLVGEKYKLDPKLEGGLDGAAKNTVSYRSDTPAVATVGFDGIISAKSPGTCFVAAATGDGSKQGDKVLVTVVQGVNYIKFTDTTKTVDIGDEFDVRHSTSPRNLAEGSITWSSSNSTVAKVDDKGHVSVIAAGYAAITAKSNDKLGASATMDIIAYKKITELSLSENGEIGLIVGGEASIKAVITPSDATKKAIEWSSSDTSVAVVDSNGLVKGKEAGTCTILAATTDGSKLKKELKITVRQQAVGLTIIQGSYLIPAGSSSKIKYSLFPENTSDKSLSFESSDPAIAIVDENGVIKGVMPGKCEISLKTLDGTGISKSVSVTVAKVPVEGVSLSDATRLMYVGETIRLSVTFKPENATSKGINYRSSNTKAAEVDDSGNIKAVGAGRATITVETAEGNFTARCEIECREQASRLEMSESSLKLSIGQKAKLKAATVPLLTTKQQVTWRSSDPTIASVGENGEVQALRKGKAAISATLGALTAKCDIEVGDLGVLCDAIILPKESSAIIGGEAKLDFTIEPFYANEKLSFSTSDPSIAVISDEGVITGFLQGNCVITVSGVKTQATTRLFVRSFSLAQLKLQAHSSGYQSAALSWDAFDIDCSFEVYRSQSAQGAYSLSGTSKSPFYMDYGLSCGQSYWYKVRGAKEEFGRTVYTDYSEAVQVTPIPSPVSISSVQPISSQEATVLFTPSEGATGYEIERSSGSSFSLAGTSSETSFKDITAKASSKISYRVRPFRQEGDEKVYGQWSEAVSSETPAEAPLLKLTAIDYNKVRVSVSGQSQDGYFVYRSDSEDGQYALVGIINSQSGQIDDTGLISGESYWYKAAAYRVESGKKISGSMSDAQKAEPLPLIPMILEKKRSGSSAYISWKSVNGATGYEILWKEGEGDWHEKAIEGISVLEYSFEAKRGESVIVKIRSYIKTPYGTTRSAYSSESAIE